MPALNIARVADVGSSVVKAALDDFSIPYSGNGHKHPSQMLFGCDYREHRVGKSKTEQDAIRLIQHHQVCGLVLREIAREILQLLFPSGSSAIWQATALSGFQAMASLKCGSFEAANECTYT